MDLTSIVFGIWMVISFLASFSDWGRVDLETSRPLQCGAAGQSFVCGTNYIWIFKTKTFFKAAHSFLPPASFTRDVETVVGLFWPERFRTWVLCSGPFEPLISHAFRSKSCTKLHSVLLVQQAPTATSRPIWRRAGTHPGVTFWRSLVSRGTVAWFCLPLPSSWSPWGPCGGPSS